LLAGRYPSSDFQNGGFSVFILDSKMSIYDIQEEAISVEEDQRFVRYKTRDWDPAWAPSTVIEAKGFGRVTQLAIATADDFHLASLVQQRAAAMTTPDLRMYAPRGVRRAA